MIVVLLLLLTIGAVLVRRRQQAPSLPEVETAEKPLPSIDDLWANGPELPFPPIPALEDELATPKLNPTETRYPLEVWTESGYEWRTLSDGTLEWNNNGNWEVYSSQENPQTSLGEPAPTIQSETVPHSEEVHALGVEEQSEETAESSSQEEDAESTSEDDGAPSSDVQS